MKQSGLLVAKTAGAVAASLLLALACTTTASTPPSPPVGMEAGVGADSAPSDPDVTVPDSAVDASVDSSCVHLRMLEARPAQPSGVALYLSVDNCAGQAVPNLALSRFDITEDGQPLAVGAQVTAVPLKGQEPFVELLFDASVQSAPFRTELASSMRSTVDAIERSGARAHFSIRVFSGPAVPETWLQPTLDVALVRKRIADLATYASTDANSADMYGAMLAGSGFLDTSAVDFRGRNMGGAFTPKVLVTFTGGGDTAKRVSQTAVTQAIGIAATSSFGVTAKGPAYDAAAAAALEAVARDGVSVATSASDLPAVGAALGLKIARQFERNYVLGYCSTARAGTHSVSVGLAAPTDTRTRALAQFSADGFGSGCSAATFQACGTNTCGGIGCGACDDRTSACSHITMGCVSFCDSMNLCGDVEFANPNGYTMKCASTPTRTPCGIEGCVNTLISPDSCGGCGKDCGALSATCSGATGVCTCAEGKCPTTSLRNVDLTTFTTDGTSVYWIDSTVLAIRKKPLVGGATTTLYTPPNSVRQLWNNAGYIYFVDVFGALQRISTTGGAVETFATSPNGVVDMAFTATAAYFNDGGNIFTVPLTGGAVTQLSSVPFDGYGEMALDGTHAYWTHYFRGYVFRVPLAGGATETLAAGEFAPRELTTTGGKVYWSAVAAVGGGTVRSVASSGGVASTFISTAAGHQPMGLRTDGVYIYWFDNNESIERTPTIGGASVRLASGQTMRGSGGFLGHLELPGRRLVWTGGRSAFRFLDL